MFAPTSAFSNFGYQEDEGVDRRAMTKRSIEAANEQAVARVMAVVPFASIDETKLQVKSRGKTKNGHLLGVYYDGHGQLAINLTPEKTDWFTLPFGIDRQNFGNYARPELTINGGQGAGEYEDLAMVVEITPDVAKVLENLDYAARQQMSEIIPGLQWHSAIKLPKNDTGANSLMLTARVVVKSRVDEHLTKFVVRPFAPEGSARKVMHFKGVESLKPAMEEYGDFRHAKAKIVLRVQKIWTKDNKAGITWQVAEMALDLQQKVNFVLENVFHDIFDY